MIVKWMEARGLKVAEQKTEVLVMKGPRNTDILRVEMRETTSEGN